MKLVLISVALSPPDAKRKAARVSVHIYAGDRDSYIRRELHEMQTTVCFLTRTL